MLLIDRRVSVDMNIRVFDYSIGWNTCIPIDDDDDDGHKVTAQISQRCVTFEYILGRWSFVNKS